MKVFSLANFAGIISSLILLKFLWFNPPSPSEDHAKRNGKTMYEIVVSELAREDDNATSLSHWLPSIIGSLILVLSVGYLIRRLCLVSGASTSDYKEIAFFTKISLLIHLMVLLFGCFVTMSLDYLFFAAVGLPIGAILLALVLRAKGKWHERQVLLASFVSLILGFLQVVVVASALSV